MNSLKIRNIFLVIFIIFNSCNDPTSNEDKMETGAITDIDGNEYKTIKIGDQWWMAENLKVTHYRDNSPIPYISDSTEWESMISDAYCNYNNDQNHANEYGSLYNWFAVNNQRGLAPQGWRIPTDDDWKTLEIFLGMSSSEADASYSEMYRGTDEGNKLKATYSWNDDGNGGDLYGFSALATGFRADVFNNGAFLNFGKHSWFWTSSGVENSNNAWLRKLKNSESGIGRNSYTKTLGLSIRCIKE